MRWLQFSDIHLSNMIVGADTLLLRRQLLWYLEKEIGSVDQIFLTGDYRFCGQPKEADEAWGWIQKLASAVGVMDLKRQIHMVPGNHDIDRSFTRGCAAEAVKKKYHPSEGRLSGETLECLLDGFSYYDSLYQKVKQHSYIKESIKKGNPHSLVDCGDFFLLLLNTALLSNEDMERGSLLAGTGYVAELMPEGEKPILVLAHHGLEMMDRGEQKKLKQIFNEWEVKLYLCGDAHELYEEYIGEACCQVTCGCLKSDVGKIDIAFMEGEIASGEILVKAHEWRENWAVNQHFGHCGILKIAGGSRKIEADWESRIEKMGSLEKELIHYLISGIVEYEHRDIPIHTPQALLLLLKYPGSVGYRVLNEYRVENGEPYGKYLCHLLEKENERYETSNYHFNRGVDLEELLGIRRAEKIRRERNMICVSENLLLFSILEEEERKTVQMLKRTFGNSIFEEIKQKIRRNVTPL